MAAEDLQLSCGVRSALTRNALDLTKTNFIARRGHVHLSGKAAIVGEHRPVEDTAGALRAFESELRRLKDVKSVSFEFTNWVRDSTGVWVCLERDEPVPPPPEAERS